ncbi:hypothetical protein PG999_004442 [Apiospora kogelbergensis]|uniref:Secreted protein n=1 Tax=Apiospora kogelbergensis TaxID=1337665 RepID=A0AAW0QZB8_9PEZI
MLARSRPLPCLLGKLGGLLGGLGAAHVVQLLGDILEGFGLAVDDAVLLGGNVVDEVLSTIDHAVVVGDLARLVNGAGRTSRSSTAQRRHINPILVVVFGRCRVGYVVRLIGWFGGLLDAVAGLVVADAV